MKYVAIALSGIGLFALTSAARLSSEDSLEAFSVDYLDSPETKKVENRGNQVYLSWSEVQFASGYNIYISDHLSFKPEHIVKVVYNVPKTDLTLSKLGNKENYFFRVEAVRDDLTSKLSDTRILKNKSIWAYQQIALKPAE